MATGGLNLQTYFGAGGDGADLDLTVQTVDGAHTWRPVIEGNTTIGANINFNAPAEARTLIEAIDMGDRFIIAFTASWRGYAAASGRASLPRR